MSRNRLNSSQRPSVSPTPELMAAIDQQMEAIKVVYPSEYNAIIAKMRSLHEAM